MRSGCFASVKTCSATEPGGIMEPDEVRAYLAAVPIDCPVGDDDYTWAVNRTAAIIVAAYDADEALRLAPVETEYATDDPGFQESIREGDVEKMREFVTEPSVSDRMRETDAWKSVPRGITGGQWACALSLARHAVGLDPKVPGPVMTIETSRAAGLSAVMPPRQFVDWRDNHPLGSR